MSQEQGNLEIATHASLLARVNAVADRHDEILRSTGGEFNVFQILSVDSDEVRVCRLIHELLDPRGSHYQGNRYLRLFNQAVLGDLFSEEEMESAEVFREYPIANSRRIDLVIKTRSNQGLKFVPIEVKIWAGDQDGQVYDYSKLCENAPLYYLTPFGNLPSKESARSLECVCDEQGAPASYEGIECVSFEGDVLQWVRLCLADHNTVQLSPIREVLLQFERVIMGLTGQIESDKEMAITQLVSGDSGSMQAARDISISFESASLDMLTRMFDALEKRIEGQFGFKPVPFVDRGERIERFYDQKGSSFPNLIYMHKEGFSSDKKGPVSLIFVIEQWVNGLVFGYCQARLDNHGCICWEGEILPVKSVETELPEYIDIHRANTWWVHQGFLPSHDKKQSPGFKQFNQAFFDLFDQEGFDGFIDATMETLSQYPPFRSE